MTSRLSLASVAGTSSAAPVALMDSLPLTLLAAELPAALRPSTRRARQRRQEAMAAMREAGLQVPDDNTTEEDELRARLEQVGSSVGAAFAERLSRDRPPPSSTLDVLKFVCKEVWTAVWEKQVDHLRTNHRGVYVLQDNAFKPLRSISTPGGPQETARAARLYLAYPIGIIRGALSRLGVPSAVVGETSQLPACTFHVKTSVAPAAAASGQAARA